MVMIANQRPVEAVVTTTQTAARAVPLAQTFDAPPGDDRPVNLGDDP